MNRDKYDRFNDDGGRAGVQDTCTECDRVLEDGDTCWYCSYQSLDHSKQLMEERLENRIRRLENERDELQGRIRDLESDNYRLEDKVRDLERKWNWR